MYSLAAQRVSGSKMHAGKVMRLAPYGDPTAIQAEMVLNMTGLDGQVVDSVRANRCAKRLMALLTRWREPLLTRCTSKVAR
jgi:predicted NodU family carbamoyl transferase